MEVRSKIWEFIQRKISMLDDTIVLDLPLTGSISLLRLKLETRSRHA